MKLVTDFGVRDLSEVMYLYIEADTVQASGYITDISFVAFSPETATGTNCKWRFGRWGKGKEVEDNIPYDFNRDQNAVVSRWRYNQWVDRAGQRNSRFCESFTSAR